MNAISILVGVVALLLVILTAIVPILGAIGAWLALGLALLGLVLGLIAAKNNGRNVNIVAIVAAVLRLMLGGGIL